MWGANPNLRILKWLAIVLPVVFLVVLDVLRHGVFAVPLHSGLGLLVNHGITTTAVVLFAYFVFGFIDRLQRRITEQNRRLTALNEMASTTAEQLRLDDLLSAGLDQVMDAMNVDAGLICLVDLEAGEHSAVCVRGFSEELSKRIQKAKLGDDAIASEVVRTGRPVIIDKVFDDPHVAEGGRREGIRSAISAPLKSKGEVNGILAIGSRRERSFSDMDQEFLDGVGGHLGLAINNALLFQQSQLQNRELSGLIEVGKAATTSIDLDELLLRTLDTVLRVTSSDAAEVWLTEDEETLSLAAHRGMHPDAFAERTTLRLGEGVPGIVAQTRERVLVHDPASDERFLRRRVSEAGFRTFCAMPLLYRDRLVGVLAVAALAADGLTHDWELRLLEGIVERVALAIENARLHQQVQDAAILQERERIAREMHDGVGQVLGYINTQTLAVKKLLSSRRLEDASAEIAAMQEVTSDLYADVREGILGLRMGPYRDGGLVPALREYVGLFGETSGIETALDFPEDIERSRLSPSAEIQLMRIIQEALTNVRKHASATRAHVELSLRNGGLEVAILDDGHGFDPAHRGRAGWPRFGLQTMRERAESIGGTFELESEVGEGTRVAVQIPLSVEQVASA